MFRSRRRNINNFSLCYGQVKIPPVDSKKTVTLIIRFFPYDMTDRTNYLWYVLFDQRSPIPLKYSKETCREVTVEVVPSDLLGFFVLVTTSFF